MSVHAGGLATKSYDHYLHNEPASLPRYPSLTALARDGASAGDDVEPKNSGAMSTNVSDLELGYDGSTAQTDGLRFTGINIPQGAIITRAYIQFQANEVKTGAASLLIQGANVDDASAFTSKVFNVSSLPRTTASTALDGSGVKHRLMDQ
ncbi:hypothetical protein ABID26_003996 [Mesorhizobium shonense]|uniref:Uncharacterized protein n=1 Tax=Mesorhizobium shonense TaxID=1209948 RepID=A0ABV2HW85_9HYPH